MKRFILLSMIALLAQVSVGQAEVEVGVSIDEEGLKGFYLAVGEHYNAPEKEVVLVRQRQISDEELPVIFFLARRAEVAPTVVTKLRLSGKTWMEIALHFGLTAEVFYVDFQQDPGPPYGKAWGHFKKKKRADWSEIRLVDAEVVNLVNLKFLAERTGQTPSDIAKKRNRGDSFVTMHKSASGGKKQAMAESSKKSQGKGKAKGKKK